MKVSVIVCAYNAEHRIKPTLEHLCLQDVPPDTPWEVVLVDNASTDRTAVTARESWRLDRVPLIVIQESRPGLMFARERGIAAAAGEYLLFCDDDNWLAPDYIRRAVQIMDSEPSLGALGGFGEAVADVELPPWFQRYQAKYACGPCGGGKMLSGAGIVIRRNAYEQLIARGFKSQLPGRIGTALSSCDDTELTIALNIIGWKLKQETALKFKHYMTASRLTTDYLLRIAKGISLGYPIVREYLMVQSEAHQGKRRMRQRVPQWPMALLDMARGLAWSLFPRRKNLIWSLERVGKMGCGRGAFNLLWSGKVFHLRQQIRKLHLGRLDE